MPAGHQDHPGSRLAVANVLVVDDRPTNRLYLIALLEHLGHRTLEASDGFEALEVARREMPDLIISDIQMPGMDGLELVTRIRADPAIGRSPVVFYTAAYEEHDAHR